MRTDARFAGSVFDSGVTAVQMTDIDGASVRQAVHEMGQRFRTKDVWEHPVTSQAHAWISNQHSFQQLLGKYLHLHSSEVGIHNLTLDGQLAHWKKV